MIIWQADNNLAPTTVIDT